MNANSGLKVTLGLLALALSGGAGAQSPAPAVQPAPSRAASGARDQVNPAVDTSANPAVDTSALPTGSPPPSSGPGNGAAAAAAEPAAQPVAPAAPDAPGARAQSAAGTSAAANAAAGERKARGAATPVDRLQLGTTEISGNRELPKVLYVVPWRRAELGDLMGRPPSLVDEALSPVDREVFQRQNRYYAALEAGAGSAKSQPGTAVAGGEGAARKDER